MHGNETIYEEMSAKFCNKIWTSNSNYFRKAVESGNIVMVQRALGFGSINHDFGDGKTILHVAAGRGHIRLIEWLLQENPIELDPRATDNLKNTIIHDSVLHGCYLITVQLYQEYFAVHDQKSTLLSRGIISLFQPNK